MAALTCEVNECRVVAYSMLGWRH